MKTALFFLLPIVALLGMMPSQPAGQSVGETFWCDYVHNAFVIFCFWRKTFFFLEKLSYIIYAQLAIFKLQ